MSPILNWPEALALIAFIAPTARAQNAADSELEDRNAAACLVKDSGYWNREPVASIPTTTGGRIEA
jgi:hypothetical protein